MPAEQQPRAPGSRRRPWWPQTIRWRVTVVASLVVAAVLVGGVAALLVAQRAVLTEQLDEQLQADADRLDGDVAASWPGPFALDIGGDDDAVAMVATLDGGVLASNAPGARRTAIGVIPAGAGDERQTSRSVDDDGSAYRVLSRRVGTPGGEVVLQLASPRDDIDESMRALVVASTIGLPLVTAVLALVIWIVVGRTLRPVERIRAEVAAIEPRQLDRRVPMPRGDDEVARLAATMNAMLARLDAAARRQARFTADASHELRTPLTRMRAELEVLQSEAAPARSTGTDSLLQEVHAMQRLVDDLLLLAKGDESGATAPTRVVDLDDVVLDEVRALARSRVVIDASEVSGAQVTGVPDQLRRAVRNLFDNALRHAASTVRVGLGEAGGLVTLRVDDDGPGVPADRRAEIFERFSRADDARGVAAGGTGLGLAIVREVVERHGGTVELDADHHPGARFVVTLPVAPNGSAASPPVASTK